MEWERGKSGSKARKKVRPRIGWWQRQMRDVNGFGDRTVRTVVRLDVGVKPNERNQD